jgi:hypothetical protein
MKKNKMMRIASVLLVAVLLSTCAISGTYAKYITETEVKDAARVAYWGFDAPATQDFKLFDHNDTNITSANGDKVIAPGSTAEASFAFGYTAATTPAIGAPEVNYTFTVNVATTGTYTALDNNPSFTWYLEKNGTKVNDYNTVADLVNAIKALSGDASGTKSYNAGTLPAAFTAADEVYTIGWNWAFDDGSGTKNDADNAQNVTDTAMGNMSDLNEIGITITITATQVD